MRQFPAHMKKRHRVVDNAPLISSGFYAFDFFAGEQTIMRIYIDQRVIEENRQVFNNLLNDLRPLGIRHEVSQQGNPKFVLDSIQAVSRKFVALKATHEALQKTWKK